MSAEAPPHAQDEVHLTIERVQLGLQGLLQEEYGSPSCTVPDRQRQAQSSTSPSKSWAWPWPFGRYWLPLAVLLFIVTNRAGLLPRSWYYLSGNCPPCPGKGLLRVDQVLHHLAVTGAGGSQGTVSLPRLGLPATPLELLHLHEAAADTVKMAPEEAEDPGGRQLSGSRSLSSSTDTTNSSTTSSSAANHEEHSHPHEAMFFLVGAIIVGTLVTHVMMHPLFHGLQQSVVLFVLGVCTSFVIEGVSLHDNTGVFGRSYSMWMVIDPHLLLFTMLPPLVTGDAMSIDTNVAKRVARQCLYLAGPGVLFAAFLTALFMYAYLGALYNWSFLLCLTCGSILCATDPVAVVALLKELGASPTLTVQIQGESLLNDGTAIVLYTISYNMLRGESYDVGDIITFLVKMAIYAWGLGMVIGWFFYQWIKMANNKLNHHSSVIQVSLTICCAYSSFIIAEGGFHISGVLATVSAALVLAHKMWSEVANQESMHTVWHMLEYLGNTVIFFLAGALSGKTMIHIRWVDYLHLLVIYIVVTVIRGMLIFASRPLLKHLNMDLQEVTTADAMVMTWGGLRGAIGLALAIQVSMDRADGKVNQDDADRVLFYVCGVAALTLIVNATTCPSLVKYLGITQMPETKLRMLSSINRQLLSIAYNMTKPGHVREQLCELLGEVEHHINVPMSATKYAKEVGDRVRSTVVGANLATARGSFQKDRQAKAVLLDDDDFPRQKSNRSSIAGGQTPPPVKQISTGTVQKDFHAVSDEFRKVKALHMKIPENTLISKLTGTLPEMPWVDQQEDMLEMVRTEPVDLPIQRAVNEAFLHLVHGQYWQMIMQGRFFGSEAEQVIASITLALSSPHTDLEDFSYIEPFIKMSFEESHGRISRTMTQARSTHPAKNKEPVEEPPETPLHCFIESPAFAGTIAITIFSNAVFTAIEQETRGEHDHSVVWLVAELTFTVIFTAEFIVKFLDLKLWYFTVGWNLFDFTLVVLGWIGCVFSIIVQTLPATEADGTSSVPASESRLIRVAQVFRMMRIVRLFRLYRFWLLLKSKLSTHKLSLEVAEHMQKTFILTSFSRAHIQSQALLVKYFGRNSKVDSVEVARCILQSQISVYKALFMAEKESKSLDRRLLENVCIAEENRAVTEDCEAFIIGAHTGGILTAYEAESILHPLHDHIGKFLKCINDHHRGYVDELVTDPAPAADDAVADSEGSPVGGPKSAATEQAPPPTSMGRQLLTEPAQEPAPEGLEVAAGTVSENVGELSTTVGRKTRVVKSRKKKAPTRSQSTLEQDLLHDTADGTAVMSAGPSLPQTLQQMPAEGAAGEAQQGEAEMHH